MRSLFHLFIREKNKKCDFNDHLARAPLTRGHYRLGTSQMPS